MGLLRKTPGKFTYADYLSQPDNERWEIIDGQAYNIPLIPVSHQMLIIQLLPQFKIQLKDTCRVIPAPFTVRLPLGNQKETDIENVVQPDMTIVCDAEKLDEKGCLGPPDMIIEILSPQSYRKDRKEKFSLYERSGVKEYWLISPDDKLLEVFCLDSTGKYGRPSLYTETDMVSVSFIKNVTIDLNAVFSIQLA
ncbi:MAG: Uma2 family endonuclease [Acidobacteria bacterium]|jgi:Uma2 family endonuclease|nr:Uma2 family endonuclease [Acidobacteriota bacterium]